MVALKEKLREIPGVCKYSMSRLTNVFACRSEKILHNTIFSSLLREKFYKVVQAIELLTRQKRLEALGEKRDKINSQKLMPLKRTGGNFCPVLFVGL